MAYSLEEKGSLYSTDYRLYMKSGGRYISPFHDIPLYADRESCVFNMLVEIPRWTNAKMEIKLSEPLNPIMQDVKKGQVRFVKNCFPYHGYMWNYGTFPQTWEDPSHVDPDTRAEGDNDPVDVCEIGQRVWARGDVRQVKVLGTIALIDEGETDWKILAIDVTDPLATQMNGIQDIEKHMPGFLKVISGFVFASSVCCEYRLQCSGSGCTRFLLESHPTHLPSKDRPKTVTLPTAW
jgi:inorganic pyrophosphatase